jgi:uncharacterized protein with HEPN domain
MSESDAIRLRHMLDAAREAVAFGAGRAWSDLAGDRVLALALVRCIEIIGEAASRVSETVRADHPEIPWFAIVGMRNRLIHAYFDVDLERVHDTLELDLPPLIKQLEQILETNAPG